MSITQILTPPSIGMLGKCDKDTTFEILDHFYNNQGNILDTATITRQVILNNGLVTGWNPVVCATRWLLRRNLPAIIKVMSRRPFSKLRGQLDEEPGF